MLGLCSPHRPSCHLRMLSVLEGTHNTEPKSCLRAASWAPRWSWSLLFLLNSCTHCPFGVRGPERRALRWQDAGGWSPRWIASSLQAGTVSCSQRHPRTLACGWDVLSGTREALDKRWMVVMTHQKKLRMEDSKEALSPDRRHSLTAETPLCPQLSVCIL